MKSQFLGTRLAVRPAPFSSPVCSSSPSLRESRLPASHPAGFSMPPTPKGSWVPCPSFLTESCSSETPGSSSFKAIGSPTTLCTRCAVQRVKTSTSCFTVRLHVFTTCTPVNLDASTLCAPRTVEKVDSSIFTPAPERYYSSTSISVPARFDGSTFTSASMKIDVSLSCISEKVDTTVSSVEDVRGREVVWTTLAAVVAAALVEVLLSSSAEPAAAEPSSSPAVTGHSGLPVPIESPGGTVKSPGQFKSSESPDQPKSSEAGPTSRVSVVGPTS